MNDEIKEILEFDFQSQGERIEINEYERDILRYYITNLQQEYKNSQITLAEEWKKRLEAEEKIKHLDNQITMLKQQNNVITEMGLNYKSRIDKAIELLNKRKEEYEDFSWVEMPKELYYEECDEIINLLKGDDENEK